MHRIRSTRHFYLIRLSVDIRIALLIDLLNICLLDILDNKNLITLSIIFTLDLLILNNFLKRFLNLCNKYKIINVYKIIKLFRYCDKLIENFVKFNSC